MEIKEGKAESLRAGLINRPVMILCKSAPAYRGKIKGHILTEALIKELSREGVFLDDGSFIFSSNIVSIGPYMRICPE